MEPKSKILVIEDEVFVQQLLGHLLEANDYDVALSSSATEGLEIFNSTAFALVILDLNLPDSDGMTVARRMRSHSDVAIIVLSARETQEDRAKAVEIGVDDYIAKPVDPQDLILRVNTLLGHG